MVPSGVIGEKTFKLLREVVVIEKTVSKLKLEVPEPILVLAETERARTSIQQDVTIVKDD